MSEEKYIYIVTAIEFGYMYGDQHRSPDGIYRSYRVRTSEEQKKYFTIIDSRTWGWFSDLETARQSVEENWGDMYEGQYNHILIEKVPEGVVVNVPEEEHWYKWEGPFTVDNTIQNNYKLAEKPEEYHNVISFWGAAKDKKKK